MLIKIQLVLGRTLIMAQYCRSLYQKYVPTASLIMRILNGYNIFPIQYYHCHDNIHQTWMVILKISISFCAWQLLNSCILRLLLKPWAINYWCSSGFSTVVSSRDIFPLDINVEEFLVLYFPRKDSSLILGFRCLAIYSLLRRLDVFLIINYY